MPTMSLDKLCKFILATSAVTSLIGASAPARAQSNPDREAYFGETHLHTRAGRPMPGSSETG